MLLYFVVSELFQPFGGFNFFHEIFNGSWGSIRIVCY